MTARIRRSPYGTLLPPFDWMWASGNAPSPQAVAPDEGQASAAAQSAPSALLRSWRLLRKAAGVASRLSCRLRNRGKGARLRDARVV
jgi:hypothetical protein